MNLRKCKWLLCTLYHPPSQSDQYRFKAGPFLYRKCEDSIKSLMFLHHVNNVDRNIKQNIYIGMEVQDTVYKSSKNENVLINNTNNL